jgi:hypothetical protein
MFMGVRGGFKGERGSKNFKGKEGDKKFKI